MIVRRLRREEEGYALITAVLLLAIMSLLMIVSLSAGNAVGNLTGRGVHWTSLLTVAESGINDAVARLSVDRNATPSSTGCAYTGSATTACNGPGGEYQVTWQKLTRGRIVITSYGVWPSASSWLGGSPTALARKVQVTMAPPKSFKYALFSETTLELKNDAVVIGDVFSNEKMTMGNNTILCGSIVNATLGVDMGVNSQVVKSLAGSTCDADGDVLSGGTISNGGVIEGNATASGPTEQACPPTPNTNYAILGGTVDGVATACGTITSTASAAHTNTKTSPPVTESLPGFTFDAANYVDLTCFPSGGTCGPSTTSATAVSGFNAVSRSGMTGTYGVWQTQPTKNTRIDLDGLSLGGDLTIVTNAPVDFGNTATITGASGSLIVIISLYVPPTGTTCAANGGDCSIYGKNSVVVDDGDPADPDDGVAMLLYTPGKMAFKNQANAAEGALYAGSMDMKNGFDIVYNERVESVIGFGGTLERKLWQELRP